jgi:hypothetical protein
MESIERRLDLFAESFDTKDWQQMTECLADNVYIDYSSSRKTEPGLVSRSQYVEQRKTGSEGLETVHTFDHYETHIDGAHATCSCDFAIKRFDRVHNDYYHSYGKYHFNLININGSWKIEKIVQMEDRSEGNRNIHGAFK